MIVGIDPGHGGDNVGCTAFGIHEEIYTLDLGLMLSQVLTAMGLKVLLSRARSESVSFAQRAERLAAAAMVMVIHVNKAGVPTARDLRCFAMDDDVLAQAMGAEMERIAPPLVAPTKPSVTLAHKGTDTDHAYNVLAKHRPKPTVLVETFFVSNPASAVFAKAPWGPPSFVNVIAAGILLGWQRLDAAAPRPGPAVAARDIPHGAPPESPTQETEACKS